MCVCVVGGHVCELVCLWDVHGCIPPRITIAWQVSHFTSHFSHTTAAAIAAATKKRPASGMCVYMYLMYVHVYMDAAHVRVCEEAHACECMHVESTDVSCHTTPPFFPPPPLPLHSHCPPPLHLPLHTQTPPPQVQPLSNRRRKNHAPHSPPHHAVSSQSSPPPWMAWW